MRFSIKHQYNNLNLLKETGKVNNFSSSQTVTSFPINANGRKLLIGIDYNKSYNDNSIHTVICDGETMESEGFSIKSNATKEEFINSALEQVRKMLSLIPDEDF